MPKPKKEKPEGYVFGRPATWTPERIKEEAQNFLEWAMLDDSIVLREYCALRGYSHQWLTYLADKSQDFADALKIARILVGARREKGAILGKYDAGIIKATLATYDEEHRAVLKEMKRAESEGNQAIAMKGLVDYLHKTVKESDK